MSKAISETMIAVFCFVTFAIAFYLYFLTIEKVFSACQTISRSQFIRLFV